MSGEYLELISLDIWHIVASILNLLVLTLILKRFLFKPVQKMLAERQGQVDRIYREAEDSRAKAEEDRALYGEKLAGAVEEAEGIVRSASQRADRQSDEILAEANRRAAETVKRAEDKKGVIIRLYECENARTEVTLTFGNRYKTAAPCNCLEEARETRPVQNGSVKLTVQPYEIVTLRLQ